MKLIAPVAAHADVPQPPSGGCVLKLGLIGFMGYKMSTSHLRVAVC